MPPGRESQDPVLGGRGSRAGSPGSRGKRRGGTGRVVRGLPPLLFDAPEPQEPSRAWRIDWALALALVLLLGALYRGTLQRWAWNDGIGILAALSWNSNSSWPHPGYMPALRAIAWLFPADWPTGPALAASWVPAALSGGLAWLFLRGLAIGRAVALVVVLAFALSPLGWFFATTIEVHALHGAAVLLGVALLMRLGRVRSWWALPAAAVCFLPVAATHLTAPLLIPGWIALASLAPEGGPRRWRPWPWVLALAAALGAVTVFVFFDSGRQWWGQRLEGTLGSILAQIRRDQRPFGLEWWRGDLLEPLGWPPVLWLVVLLGIGVCWMGRVGSLLVARGRALLLLAMPLLVFTAWWQVPNRGGYLVAIVPALLVFSALGLEAVERHWPRGFPWALLLVLLSAGQDGLASATDWRVPYNQQQRQARAEHVRVALPDGGLLCSFDLERQPIALDVPAVLEFNCVEQIDVAFAAGDAVGEARAIAEQLVELWPEFQGRLVVDLSYRTLADRYSGLQPVAQALDLEIAQRFETRQLFEPPWALLKLAGLRSDGAGATAGSPTGR